MSVKIPNYRKIITEAVEKINLEEESFIERNGPFVVKYDGKSNILKLSVRDMWVTIKITGYKEKGNQVRISGQQIEGSLPNRKGTEKGSRDGDIFLEIDDKKLTFAGEDNFFKDVAVVISMEADRVEDLKDKLIYAIENDTNIDSIFTRGYGIVGGALV